MKSRNPTIKDSYLKTLQSTNVPLKVLKVFATNNGTIFLSTFRCSKIEES